MGYTLQQLSDLEEIKLLKHRYYRSLDTIDMDLLADLFTDDLVVDYRGGAFHVSLTGKDNMLDFLVNSYHSRTLGMHHGHQPEITFTGDDTASGLWYAEDLYIDMEARTHANIGTSFYKDEYRREGGSWKISRTELDRVFLLRLPLPESMQVVSHYLGVHGRKMEEVTDISRFVTMTKFD